MSQTADDAQIFIDELVNYIIENPEYFDGLLEQIRKVNLGETIISRPDLVTIIGLGQAGTFAVLMDSLQIMMQQLYGVDTIVEFDTKTYRALFSLYLTTAAIYYTLGIHDSIDPVNTVPVEKREK